MALKGFKNYLNEGFVNLINDDPRKADYVDVVWDMLQRSYAPIGGIKGNGFQSKEAMMRLPMWKVATVKKKPVAVIIYKDKGGRKAVASGTDGSADGKMRIKDMVKNEIRRSYGEKSKAALGLALKLHSPEAIKQYLIKPDQVAKMSPDDEITPIKDVPKTQWPDDAKQSIEKYPYLLDYGYLRTIGDVGGTKLFKVMIGTPGQTIR